VDLLSRLGRPLVDQPEYVTEPPPRLALRHDPESDLVAHHKELHTEIPCPSQETVEFGECRLFPGRNPQGEGVEQNRFPPLRRREDFVEAPDLQRTPPTRPALPVKPYAPLQVLVPSLNSRSYIEDTLESQ
jgi:hypothetical protein